MASTITTPVPGASQYAQAELVAKTAYQNALARINKQRMQALRAAGYTADITPDTGVIANLRIDPTNQYGTYQTMLGHYADLGDTATDEYASRGIFGGLRNKAETLIRRQFGGESSALAQDLTNTLTGYQTDQTQAKTDFDRALYEAALENARQAIANGNFNPAPYADNGAAAAAVPDYGLGAAAQDYGAGDAGVGPVDTGPVDTGPADTGGGPPSPNDRGGPQGPNPAAPTPAPAPKKKKNKPAPPPPPSKSSKKKPVAIVPSGKKGKGQTPAGIQRSGAPVAKSAKAKAKAKPSSRPTGRPKPGTNQFGPPPQWFDGIWYWTYKWQVPLSGGQTLHFMSGRGYYAA